MTKLMEVRLLYNIITYGLYIKEIQLIWFHIRMYLEVGLI